MLHVTPELLKAAAHAAGGRPVDAHGRGREEVARPDLRDAQANGVGDGLELVPASHQHPLRAHATAGHVLGGHDAAALVHVPREVLHGPVVEVVLGNVKQHAVDVDQVEPLAEVKIRLGDVRNAEVELGPEARLPAVPAAQQLDRGLGEIHPHDSSRAEVLEKVPHPAARPAAHIEHPAAVDADAHVDEPGEARVDGPVVHRVAVAEVFDARGAVGLLPPFHFIVAADVFLHHGHGAGLRFPAMSARPPPATHF